MTYGSATIMLLYGLQSQIPSQTSQSAAPPTNAVSTAPTLYQSRFHWTHALYAVGLLAASGAGTAVLVKRLCEVRKNIHFVVTATSRAKRPGEVDGKDYYFVTKEHFLSMVERNELLEYALVYGDYKGIPKQQDLLLLEKQAAEEAKHAHAEAQGKNGELAKKLEEAEQKVDQLQDSVQRLEEKLSNTV